MSSKKNIHLKYAREYYTPAGLAHVPLSIQKKEYSHLRAIVSKRLKRIGETEFSSTEFYRQNTGKYGFRPLKELNETQLRYELSALVRAAENPVGTLSGMKEKRRKDIEKFHDTGLTFVNEKNYLQFIEFLQEARARGYDKIYDSGDEEARLFNVAQEAGISTEEIFKNFENYINNIDELEKLARDAKKHPRRKADTYYKTKLRKDGKWTHE